MLTTLPRTSPTDEIQGALERDGAVIVSDFLSQDAVDALARDFAPHLAAVDWGNTDAGEPDEFFGFRTKRLHGLLARSPHFADLITDSLLLALCERILGPHCRDYRVSTGELMALGRGEDRQTLHRDADSWLHVPKPRPELLVSANVALTEFTEKNGATVVTPGSHRWPPERRASEAERCQAVMSRGSALLYSGDVLHGGGANQTDEVRIGMYLGFVLSWLRPLENHLITNGEAAIRATPARAQRLLDFSEAGWDVMP